MSFALLFIIFLAIALLLGAYFISKSDLPDQDKIVSIIALLGLFSIVSIVNEVKKPSISDIKLSAYDLEKSFYSSADIGVHVDYRIPILNDFKSVIVNTLEGWDAEKQESSLFGVIYHEGRVGKTLSTQEYIKNLHNKRIPALYINIKNSTNDLEDLTSLLRISSLFFLDESLEQMNKYGKIPTIFIDNVQNMLLEDNNMKLSPILSYLQGIYDKYNVSLILLTNDKKAVDIIRSSYSLGKRMKIYKFYDRAERDIESYLLEKINYGIKPEQRRFTKENIKDFVSYFVWDFKTLYEYTSAGKYATVEDFISVSKSNNLKNHLEDSELKQLISCIQEFYSDFWVEYGSIKRNCKQEYVNKLDVAVEANLLLKDDNKYKIKSKAN